MLLEPGNRGVTRIENIPHPQSPGGRTLTGACESRYRVIEGRCWFSEEMGFDMGL